MNRRQRRAHAKLSNRADDPRAARLLEQGLQYQKVGRLAEAEGCYHQALTIQPNHADSLQLLGAVAYQRGHYDVAADWISRAIAEKPYVPAWFTNLGLALERQGKLEEALASQDKAIKLKPDYEIALNNRANLLNTLGRPNDALADYDRALALNPDYAEALNNRSNSLQALGRFEESLVGYDKALKLRPDYADACNNRGNLLKLLGRAEEALASYDRAVDLNPAAAKAFNGRGMILRDMSRPEDALASYDKALALRPDFIEAHNNRGLLLAELMRFDDALSSYDRALALNPNLVSTLNNRGNLLQELDRAEDALASYERALSLDPDYVAAINGKGNSLHQLKRFHEAEETLRQAIKLKPDYAEAYCNLGKLLVDLGNLSEAEALIRHAMNLKPESGGILLNLGKVLIDLGRFDEADEVLRHAIALEPSRAKAHYNLGITCIKRGKLDEAEAVTRRAIALRPNEARAHHNLSVVLMELGRLTEAQEASRRSIELAPMEPLHFRHFGEVGRFVAGDRYLTELETLSKSEASLSTVGQIDLHFAMAKAYADTGDIDNSFKRLLSGNGLKRASIAYDEARTLAELDLIQQVFTTELIGAPQGGGEPSPTPIFILGMPRSGTTLVEQILASHPQVFGAGELKQFEESINELRSTMREEPRYPEIARHMSIRDFQALGASYLAGIRALAPAVPHVTDKMPTNFMFAGLIHLALPNATIIHVVRDPVDTCVSCFSQLFTEGNFQTYDLAELGRYYRHYKMLMAHWHRVLPSGRILDVNYEDLVADVEGVARRLLAHCNLSWDEACLEFYRTERAVRTASATQVRRPIYASSVGRWRAFEAFLAPLLAELHISA